MYHGKVNVNENDLPALLNAAEILQIKGLSDSSGKDELQSSFDMATNNESFDDQQTKETEKQDIIVIQRTQKRDREQSVLDPMAGIKICISTDAPL